MILIPHWITRRWIANHTEYTFIFEDNCLRAPELQGQTNLCSGLKHCYGIRCKKRNCADNKTAYYRDEEFEVLTKALIDEDIAAIPRDKPVIVLSKIGISLARLDEKAPATLEYLLTELAKISTDYIVSNNPLAPE